MTSLRSKVIRAGFEVLSFTGLHRWLQPAFSGIGAIFMLHHVRPRRDVLFQPNRHLEVTPEFLRATLRHVRSLGVDIVSLDEAHRRLSEQEVSRRFACFTFDDGYRDNRDFALPVLRQFDAAFTVYVTSDFADGKGRLWWVALEQLIGRSAVIEAEIAGHAVRLDTGTVAAKHAAFSRICDLLAALPRDQDPQQVVSDLCARNGFDDTLISRALCLSWDELKPFAADPLVTIGAHTISHAKLGGMSEPAALQQMTGSRDQIEQRLQQPAWHLAYPYGRKDDAGPREYALARSAGFKTAVTTEPGMIFADCARHLTALPRVSLNGDYQDERFLPILTSGAATAIWNGFRRVSST
jgi:peptidoglycan/xylan/chitin deacetylase (PgdA/CDA1 family)